MTMTGCTSKLVITSAAGCVAGLLGGINCSKDSEIVITDCVNLGNVTGTAYVGGICGYVSIASAANVSIKITDCYNGAEEIAPAIKATEENGRVGGILGSVDVRGADFTLEINGCDNYGTVDAEVGPYASGILSIYTTGAKTTGTGHKITVTACNNFGDVSAKEYGAGGIVATLADTVRAGDTAPTEANWAQLNITKCANYGAVSAVKDSVGGIIGVIFNGGSANYAKINATELYNEGAVSGTSWVGSIIGVVRPPVRDAETLEIPVTYSDWMNANENGDKLFGAIGTSLVDEKVSKWTVSNMYNKTGEEIFAATTTNDI
ncbi:MAG: hypothetical protein J6B55_07995, partial [Clostridia bacterium]|nr:hypothetical protein [Clostridia bacterium]